MRRLLGMSYAIVFIAIMYVALHPPWFLALRQAQELEREIIAKCGNLSERELVETLFRCSLNNNTCVVERSTGWCTADIPKVENYILTSGLQLRLSGYCNSACAHIVSDLIMAADNGKSQRPVCVENEEKTTLGFHQARHMALENGKFVTRYAESFLHEYHPEIQRWIQDETGGKGEPPPDDMLPMPGHVVAKIVGKC